MTDNQLLARILKRVSYWRKAIPIDPRWKISVELGDPDQETYGDLALSVETWEARITFSRELAAPDNHRRIDRVVLHEMLELADWETATLFWTLAETTDGEKILTKLYGAARNRFIEGLLPLLLEKTA